MNISRWLTRISCLLSTPHLSSLRSFSFFDFSIPQALYPSLLTSCKTSRAQLILLPNILFIFMFNDLLARMNIIIFCTPIYMIVSDFFMNRSVVGLRLSTLSTLIVAFKAVIFSGQSQTFVSTVSEERTIPMSLCLFSFIHFFF
jgi:hypothetical protein